jgi:hypothetical protein
MHLPHRLERLDALGPGQCVGRHPVEVLEQHPAAFGVEGQHLGRHARQEIGEQGGSRGFPCPMVGHGLVPRAAAR